MDAQGGVGMGTEEGGSCRARADENVFKSSVVLGAVCVTVPKAQTAHFERVNCRACERDSNTHGARR